MNYISLYFHRILNLVLSDNSGDLFYNFIGIDPEIKIEQKQLHTRFGKRVIII